MNESVMLNAVASPFTNGSAVVLEQSVESLNPEEIRQTLAELRRVMSGLQSTVIRRHLDRAYESIAAIRVRDFSRP